MLTDTHSHLYWESFQNDLDEVIKSSIEAGVTTIINVGVDVNSSKKAAEQVKSKLRKIPGLSTYSTIGIHPHEALRYTQNKIDPSVSIHKDISELEKIYQTLPNQIIAVGECGLDFFLDRNDVYPNITLPHEQIKQLQRQLFQAQIDLAKKLNLPLIVHCRDDRSKNPLNCEAWDEVLGMVSNHPTVLHCYSGFSQTTQKILLSPTLFVSFAATITYPKNEYLREAAKLLPLEKIVLETDCPFLPPQSKRGQRNEPSTILEIAKLIASLKNISLDKVADQTTINVRQIFKLN